MGVFVYVGSEPGRVWDGIIQKFTIGRYYAKFCIFSDCTFHPEKEQEGELFSLWLAQDGWKPLQKIQMQDFKEILEACPLHFLHEVCVG